jgi:hypothetical protein
MQKINIIRLKLVVLLLFSCSQATAMTSGWKLLNNFGALGSLGSFMLWTPQTLSMIDRYGFAAAIKSTHIPRLVVDAACVAAAHYKMRTPVALNTLCLLGSAASLAFWAPAICTNLYKPFYVARGVIDMVQMILAARRCNIL